MSGWWGLSTFGNYLFYHSKLGFFLGSSRVVGGIQPELRIFLQAICPSPLSECLLLERGLFHLLMCGIRNDCLVRLRVLSTWGSFVIVYWMAGAALRMRSECGNTFALLLKFLIIFLFEWFAITSRQWCALDCGSLLFLPLYHVIEIEYFFYLRKSVTGSSSTWSLWMKMSTPFGWGMTWLNHGWKAYTQYLTLFFTLMYVQDYTSLRYLKTTVSTMVPRHLRCKTTSIIWWAFLTC